MSLFEFLQRNANPVPELAERRRELRHRMDHVRGEQRRIANLPYPLPWETKHLKHQEKQIRSELINVQKQINDHLEKKLF